MANVVRIIVFIDSYLDEKGMQYLTAEEANRLLVQAGALEQSDEGPGQPLISILQRRLIPHAFQVSGDGSEWRIPNSGGDVAQCKI